jgi:predicted DCC family thiol-disulfide oxidoreductase YuxK
VSRLRALLSGVEVDYRSFRNEGVLDDFPGLSEEICERAIQLVRPDGKVFSGLNGIVRLLSQKPLGKVALIYFLPILKQLSDLAYAGVAKNRYRFNGKGTCTDLACTPDRVYRPSGRFSGTSIAASLAMGVLAAALLAVPYQWFMDTVPLGFFNLLATVLAGLFLGICVGIGSWWGQGRSAWAAVLVVLFSVAAFEIMTFEVMSARSVEGAEIAMPHGRLKVGLPIEGTWVYLIWMGEMLVLIGAASIVALRFTRWPYLEPDGGWARTISSHTSAKVDARALRRALAEERLDAVFDPPLRAESGAELKVLIHGQTDQSTRWVSAWLTESGDEELLLRWVRLTDESNDASS